MRKRLYLVLALILMSVVVVSCKEEAKGKLDPKVAAEVTDKAVKAADALDAMNSRAYQMGVVGAGMAENGIAGAADLLDNALKVAREAHGPAGKAALAEVKAATADWPEADREQIAPVIDRLEKATTRVWAVRSIAEGMAKLDSKKARAVLMDAAVEAEAIPDKRYRDLDLRGISGALLPMDADAAAGVAGKIADPRVKAYALTEIGAQAPGKAAAILASAATAAVEIQKMEPASTLLADDTPQEAKDKVLNYEKAKLAAESAKALGAVAAALYVSDRNKSGALFEQAAGIASGIEHPYTRAYAQSDVAMELADVDPQAAAQMADKIDAAHADARFAVLIKAAVVSAKKTGAVDEAGLEKAAEAAKAISEEDGYERAKALTAVALALAPANAEKAAGMASEIEYVDLRNEVLGAAAVASAKEGDDAAKKALDKIVEPRFAKAAVLYVKAKALCEMAENKAATDPAAAKKLFGKAAGAAAEARSGKLQWRIAQGLCRLDQDKLFDMAAKIESDEETKAAALSDIAADWSSRGESARASLVWDLAQKSAAGIDDKARSSEVLSAVAAKCARSDKAKAAAIFNKAAEKAVKIGVVEG